MKWRILLVMQRYVLCNCFMNQSDITLWSQKNNCIPVKVISMKAQWMKMNLLVLDVIQVRIQRLDHNKQMQVM